MTSLSFLSLYYNLPLMLIKWKLTVQKQVLQRAIYAERATGFSKIHARFILIEKMSWDN